MCEQPKRRQQTHRTQIHRYRERRLNRTQIHRTQREEAKPPLAVQRRKRSDGSERERQRELKILISGQQNGALSELQKKTEMLLCQPLSEGNGAILGKSLIVKILRTRYPPSREWSCDPVRKGTIFKARTHTASRTTETRERRAPEYKQTKTQRNETKKRRSGLVVCRNPEASLGCLIPKGTHHLRSHLYCTEVH